VRLELTPRIPIVLPLAACLAWLSSCEFSSRRAAWRLESGAKYKVSYSAELKAKADGSWGSSPYVSAAKAEFSTVAASDTSKGQLELAFAVDTLEYRSSERAPDEDEYMTGRLKKYKSKVALSRTGQVLSLEEEPGMPPVEFSPLNFGRFLAYVLPAFPDAPVKQGSRWEIVQPLLDKFHPDSRVIKRFTLSAIRETAEGDLATCLVEVEAYLDEDLGEKAKGDGDDAKKPTLTGSGQVVFNLAKGRPVSAEMDLEGRFLSRPSPKPEDPASAGSVSAPTGSGSAQPQSEPAQAEAQPLRLQERVSVRFSD
jgi:hypothetical protein